jgi:hypothetical protein
MLKILFKHGADSNLAEYALVLLLTAWHRLLESQHDTNIQMMLAEQEEQANIVEILLKSGADPEVCAKDGNSVDVVIKNSFCQWDRTPADVLLKKLLATKSTQKKKQRRKQRVLGGFFMGSGDNDQKILSISKRRSFDPFGVCAIR